MSGHSKWSQIKHKKAVTDVKRGRLFSKISRLITLAAKEGGADSPKLKLAVEKAKQANMPVSNIEKAIKKAVGPEKENLEEVVYEAYGPTGTALIIEAITDNKNRTTAEIKHILNQYEAKIAAPGSALWAFEKKDGEWQPKHLVPVENNADKEKLKKLLEELENHDDAQNVIANASL